MKIDSKVLNVGVIGAGWWGTYAHIPGIVAHKQAVLLAVQSKEKVVANQVAHDFRSQHAFDKYEDLLAVDALDAVVVSSTPNLHFEQAEHALSKGKHVLIEKPMTFTVSQASLLCKLAEENKLELVLSSPWHYTIHAKSARKLISAGELGKIKMISILMTNPIQELLKGINTTPTHGMDNVYLEPGKGSYNDPSIAGGGQIYCQIPHPAAYLGFLTGLKPTTVYAKFDYAGSVNDIYNALTITLSNGALVNIASTAATPRSERNYEVRVFGTKAILQMELWKGTMTYIPFEGKRKDFIALEPHQIYPEQAPVTNFINTCLGEASNESDGKLGLTAIQIVESAIKSNQLGIPITIREDGSL
ncbi:MAG: Gfo/Idh/MocA family oxidoreductase [Bacteroidota bacterium]